MKKETAYPQGRAVFARARAFSFPRRLFYNEKNISLIKKNYTFYSTGDIT
jgi:hypothetical protein